MAWLIIQWRVYEDGTDEVINLKYRAEATEAEVCESFDSFIKFLLMTKEKLEELQKCFEVPEDDRDYIPERFPLMPPDPKSIDEYDLYKRD